MPVMFENFQADKKNMLVFRNSIIAALTTCFVLDTLWYYASINQVFIKLAVMYQMTTSDPYSTLAIVYITLSYVK